MDMDTSPIDKTMAILAGQQLIYILREDPGELIAKKFPAHPDHAFVVEWFVSELNRIASFWLTDTGQVHEGPGFFEQTALFDTFEEAKVAADEFDRRAGVGTTIALKWEVGSLPPPKGGRGNSWRKSSNTFQRSLHDHDSG